MLMQILADQSHHLAFLHDAETRQLEWSGRGLIPHVIYII